MSPDAFSGPAVAARSALNHDARAVLADAVQAVANGSPALARLYLVTLSDAELDRALSVLARTLGVLGEIREGRDR